MRKTVNPEDTMKMITKRRRKSFLEKALMTGAVVMSAYVMKIGVDSAYEKATGRRAPRNPKQDEAGWKEALIWSAATGALLGVAKVALRPKIDSGVKRLVSKKRGDFHYADCSEKYTCLGWRNRLFRHLKGSSMS